MFCFFQAEDGIRDYKVTGVQTCALPICGRADPHDGDAAGELGEALLELLAVPVGVGLVDLTLDLRDAALHLFGRAGAVDEGQIGRASCREGGVERKGEGSRITRKEQ